jgi:hypothetical protein
MDKEYMNVYEVERDDYVGYVHQLKKDKVHSTQIHNDDDTSYLKIYSNTTDTLLAEQFFDGEELHYFIYVMPEDDERQAAPAVRRIVLETPEEVEAFFKVLNEVTKKND